MTIIKDSKADFIPGDDYNGVLQERRQTELNLEYSKEKWEFVAQRQCW